jgi:OOP family OmpA-OmpF porin
MWEIFVIPVILTTLAIFLQDDAPTGKIILLPDENGVVGEVVVESSAGTQTLNTAYATVDVKESGALLASTENATSIQSQYGTLLEATPPSPRSFVLNFVSGSGNTLTDDSLKTIGEMQAYLQTRPAPEISVIGHTDTVGDDAENDDLSAERAKAVRKLIENAGVTAVTMEASGRGERELLIPTADKVDEPRNRRVEINIR